MNHIIDKLLLICKIGLIDDILGNIKEIYIMSNVIAILPPTAKDWQEYKKHEYEPLRGIYNRYVYTNNYGHRFIQLCGSDLFFLPELSMSYMLYEYSNNELYGITYMLDDVCEVLYLGFNNSKLHSNNVFYNKNILNIDDDITSTITPIYYILPN